MGNISISLIYESPKMFHEWIKFRAIHPFSKDPYVATPENFKRWTYMNREAMAIKSNINALPKITVDNGLLLSIRAIYGVKSFEQFPAITQCVYLQIAKCFPGSQVYACGSRVRGDYADHGIYDPESERQVLSARRKAGLKYRVQSDYDFWVEPGANQVGELPPNTDRCRLRIPENEKIPIPIYR